MLSRAAQQKNLWVLHTSTSRATVIKHGGGTNAPSKDGGCEPGAGNTEMRRLIETSEPPREVARPPAIAARACSIETPSRSRARIRNSGPAGRSASARRDPATGPSGERQPEIHRGAVHDAVVVPRPDAAIVTADPPSRMVRQACSDQSRSVARRGR
jgi:hypothetical protein